MPATPQYQTRKWLGMSLPFTVGVGVDLLARRVDILMVGLLLGTSPCGLYRFAALGAEVSLLGVQAVSLTLLPMVARLHAAADSQRLAGLLLRASVASLGAILLIGGGVVVFARPALAMFKPEFLECLPVLFALVGVHAAGQLFGPVREVALMVGEEKLSARIAAASVLANLLLNALLIPRLGVLGAAWATGLSLVLGRAALWLTLRRRAGIDASPLAPLFPAPSAR